MAIFLYIAYGILILTPSMVMWTVFVFRQFRPKNILQQTLIYFACGIISFLLAWGSLMSNNEIFILAFVVMNAVLLIINTVRGIFNLKRK